MTPFGERLRQLRAARGISQKQMARDLEISNAYLSALEHGRRGVPTRSLLIQICTYFNIIWDEAEELERLAGLSDPKVTVDTAGLDPRATRLANLVARRIATLDGPPLDRLLAVLDAARPDGQTGRGRAGERLPDPAD